MQPSNLRHVFSNYQTLAGVWRMFEKGKRSCMHPRGYIMDADSLHATPSMILRRLRNLGMYKNSDHS